MIRDRAIIVLCERDLSMARLLRDNWVKSGNRITDLLQVSTDGAIISDVEAMIPVGISEGHPNAVNDAFKHLIGASKESFNFLFLEPDCAIHPEAKDLLLGLSQSLTFRGGKILGKPIHVPGHGWSHNGVAYYAHDVGDFIDLSKLPDNEPFDDWLSDQIYPKLLSPTAFIQHTQVGGITGSKSLDIFGQALIHHGCKDESLKRLCLSRS